MVGGQFKFGPFELDRRRGLLSARGQPVHTGSRGLALLQALLQAEGGVLSREELMDAAWPGATIEDSNLTVQIAAVRKCLSELSDGVEWIETVPRVGYRFVGAIIPETPAAERAAVTVPSRDTLARKPSVIVLPFRNLGDDPDQTYFTDGLSEDLITDLSKVPGLTVIARYSSFSYRRKGVDAAAIAAELGVRYLVEGSVRRAGNRIRINVELINVADSTQLWADRFDRDLAEIFGLQDEIVGWIVKALAGALPRERYVPRTRATNLDAYDLFVRGRGLVMQSRESNRAARPLLQEAIELDPGFADAHAWLAMSYCVTWTMWGEDFEGHRAPALSSAIQAVRLDQQNADGQMILGYIHAYDGDLATSAVEFAEALRINPNHADAWALLTDLRVFEGRAKEGLECIEFAFRLNPYPPRTYYWVLGFANYAARRYEQAVEALRHEATYRTGSQRILAASLAQLGRLDEAKSEAEQFLAADPGFNVRQWANAHPFSNPNDREHFVEGYRKAGLPVT